MAEMVKVDIVSCERKTPLTSFERTVREWNPLSRGIFRIFTTNMTEEVQGLVIAAFTGKYVPNGQRVEISIGSRVGEKRLQFTWEVTGENFYSYAAIQFFPTLEKLIEKYEDYISHHTQ